MARFSFNECLKKAKIQGKKAARARILFAEHERLGKTGVDAAVAALRQMKAEAIEYRDRIAKQLPPEAQEALAKRAQARKKLWKPKAKPTTSPPEVSMNQSQHLDSLGRTHKEHLKAYCPNLYRNMELSEELLPYLLDVQESVGLRLVQLQQAGYSPDMAREAVRDELYPDWKDDPRPVEPSSGVSQPTSPQEVAELFPLHGYWESTFKSISKSLRSLVRKRDLPPSDLVAIAKLIFALDRLPATTEGIAIEASASTSHEHGSGSLIIQLYSHVLDISYLDSFYDPQGVESDVNTILTAEVGADRYPQSDPCEVFNDLEDWVSEWRTRILSDAYEFQISDGEPELDWDQPVLKNAWELLSEQD